MSMFLRLGNVGWYCITKGGIFFRAFLFFCSSAFFLSVKMTSERCFSTVVAGYSLFFIFFIPRVLFKSDFRGICS